MVKTMKRFWVKAFAFTIGVALCLLSAGVGGRASAQARPQRAIADDTSKLTGAHAVALYEEAAGYARKKFDDLAKTNVPYNETLKQKIIQEQRELALRNAAQLAALGPLRGTDIYYLGMLYVLAEKSEGALDAMRRFLSEEVTASDDMKQNARSVLVQQAVKLNLLPEAEKGLNDYASHTPQSASTRYRLETLVAIPYHRKKQFAQAAGHARAAYNAVLELTQGKTLDRAQRDSLLYGSASVLAESLLKADKRDEAIAVLQEVRRLALAFPSASLYGKTTEMLVDFGEPISPLRIPASAPPPAANKAAQPPEISVNEWIDQTPFKLADLRGRVVLLDFWATWCGPCRITIPKLNALYRKYKDRGLVIVGLTNYFGNAEGQSMTPPQELTYLRQFKKRNNVAYGFGVTDNQINMTNYGVSALPTAILIDRHGAVRLITVSASVIETETLDAMVRKLIEEE